MKKTLELLLLHGNPNELLEDMYTVNKFNCIDEKETFFPEYFKLSYGMNENMVKYNFNAIKGESHPYEVKKLELSKENTKLRDDIIYDIGLEKLGYENFKKEFRRLNND